MSKGLLHAQQPLFLFIYESIIEKSEKYSMMYSKKKTRVITP